MAPRRRPDPEEVARLLAASVAGDRSAFERLVDLHRRLVWSVIRLHRLGEADAEDVFQVVFLRLYERQAAIDDGTKLASWLATTARRECVAAAARAGRQAPSLVDDLADPGEDTADHVAHRLVAAERRSALATAFLDLPPRCRDLLRLLAANDALGYDAISEVLGIPKGSIGPTRQRCIEKLRGDPGIRRLSEERP